MKKLAAVVLVTMFISTPALSQTTLATSHPCVHEVPIGSHVNGATGNVTDDDGNLLVHYEPGVCGPSDKNMALPSNDLAPSSYTGWIEGIVANPVNLNGSGSHGTGPSSAHLTLRRGRMGSGRRASV